MCKKIYYPGFLLPLFCFLLFIVLAGCGPGTNHAGTYIAEIEGSPLHSEATLELKETGAGAWKVGDDQVAFSWHVKGNELRFYAKNGGVIVGNLDNQVIRVTLPGYKELIFRKVK
jgi:hypothetical protein